MPARRLDALLVLLAAAVVLAVRVMPLSLSGVPASAREHLRYEGPDGRSHVYLGDLDSYLWLRHARNYLRTGTTCDAVVDGECRDTFGSAPVGQPMLYGRSPSAASIDGATLRTRVPYWLARALLPPSERETVGLPRMLNCGSDVTAPMGSCCSA